MINAIELPSKGTIRSMASLPSGILSHAPMTRDFVNAGDFEITGGPKRTQVNPSQRVRFGTVSIELRLESDDWSPVNLGHRTEALMASGMCCDLLSTVQVAGSSLMKRRQGDTAFVRRSRYGPVEYRGQHACELVLGLFALRDGFRLADDSCSGVGLELGAAYHDAANANPPLSVIVRINPANWTGVVTAIMLLEMDNEFVGVGAWNPANGSSGMEQSKQVECVRGRIVIVSHTSHPRSKMRNGAQGHNGWKGVCVDVIVTARQVSDEVIDQHAVFVEILGAAQLPRLIVVRGHVGRKRNSAGQWVALDGCAFASYEKLRTCSDKSPSVSGWKAVDHADWFTASEACGNGGRIQRFRDGTKNRTRDDHLVDFVATQYRDRKRHTVGVLVGRGLTGQCLNVLGLWSGYRLITEQSIPPWRTDQRCQPRWAAFVLSDYLARYVESGWRCAIKREGAEGYDAGSWWTIDPTEFMHSQQCQRVSVAV